MRNSVNATFSQSQKLHYVYLKNQNFGKTWSPSLIFFQRKKKIQKDLTNFQHWKMILRIIILRCSRRVFIILVSLTEKLYSEKMLMDFPWRFTQLFFLLCPDVAKSLPCWLSQFTFSKLRQPTGQTLSNVRAQQNKNSIGPILFLYN